MLPNRFGFFFWKLWIDIDHFPKATLNLAELIRTRESKPSLLRYITAIGYATETEQEAFCFSIKSGIDRHSILSTHARHIQFYQPEILLRSVESKSRWVDPLPRHVENETQVRVRVCWNLESYVLEGVCPILACGVDVLTKARATLNIEYETDFFQLHRLPRSFPCWVSFVRD